MPRSCSFLAEADAALRDRLLAARASAARGARRSPNCSIALAPHLDDFLARLFGIEAEAQALAARHHELAPLYSVKRLFVQRRALHKVKPESDADDAAERASPFSTGARLSRAACTRMAEG